MVRRLDRDEMLLKGFLDILKLILPREHHDGVLSGELCRVRPVTIL